jgi:UDP-N-acetylmuramyl pentapeptide phosphotransferase/UDP-N-acetylglucosamine-1-phosphate transferase
VTTQLLLIAAIAMAVSYAGSVFLIGYLQRRQMVDAVNERSSHLTPKPRGGGIAIVVSILCGLLLDLLLGQDVPGAWLLALIPFAGLAWLSWRDDRTSLPWKQRLFAQACAVAFGLAVLVYVHGINNGINNGMNIWVLAAVPILFLGWLWFTNAYNFMDGIDGMAAIEAISIGAGLVLCAALLDTPMAAGLVVAGAAAGFLFVNWAPARIFMGDVGSIPLGFVLGFLLCDLALSGYWAAALILPGYFLADATLTLLRRLFTGEDITQPHRSHWYQRAAGLEADGHRRVMQVVVVCNGLLIILAMASVRWAAFLEQLTFLAVGVLVAVGALNCLSRIAHRRSGQ